MNPRRLKGNPWRLLPRERLMIRVASLVRGVRRFHKVEERLHVSAYLLLLLLLSLSSVWVWDQLTYGLQIAIKVLGVTNAVLLSLAVVVRRLGQRFEPVPFPTSTLPRPDALDRLPALEADDVFRDLDDDDDPEEFVTHLVGLADEAFCFYSGVRMPQRRMTFHRWLRQDPRYFSLIYPPRSIWSDTLGAREPIGFTCVLRLSKNVAALLRNGKLWQLDLIPESAGSSSRFVYVQAAYIRPQARRLLASIVEYRHLPALAILRHVGRVARGPMGFVDPYLLAVGLTRRGRRKLRDYGLDTNSSSYEGAPVFELDCDVHATLLNPTSRTTGKLVRAAVRATTAARSQPQRVSSVR